MDVTMVIPTFWARASTIGWQEGDAVYDHPTPLDHEGTLLAGDAEYGDPRGQGFSPGNRRHCDCRGNRKRD